MRAATSSPEERETAPEDLKRREVERVYPLLTFHYGIQPDVLVGMPRNLKELYIEALPGILAGEQLRAIESQSYPHMTEQDQRATQKRLRDLLPDSGPTQEGFVPRSIDELKMFAAATGVGVVVEPKAKAPAPAEPPAEHEATE